MFAILNVNASRRVHAHLDASVNIPMVIARVSNNHRRDRRARTRFERVRVQKRVQTRYFASKIADAKIASISRVQTRLDASTLFANASGRVWTRLDVFLDASVQNFGKFFLDAFSDAFKFLCVICGGRVHNL